MARLRFAPSPTGPLHLGGARTALYNWAAARALGGAFLLRIEDTDRARSTEESLRIILDGLAWLGIDWDEGPGVGGPFGPYSQSERVDVYARYAERLLDEGYAYRCYATPEEVAAGRERLQQAGKRPMYDRRDRDLSDEQRAAYEAEGRAYSLRFRMPLDETRVLDDLAKGPVEINLQELDDWVMVRPDGMPTYNFACVVDDLEMEISHVVRGEEHLMNGFKQLVLFEVLGETAPRYAHIPLILGANGKKLSKRDAVTNILDYRDRGYLPEAVFNYIALLGWGFSGDRDLFTREEMLEKFRIEDIGSGGSRFDPEKLDWMVGDYIRRLPVAEFVDRSAPWFGDQVPAAALETHRALVENAARCYQERVGLLTELGEKIAFVFQDRLELDQDAEKKLAKADDAPKWLAAFADVLERSNAPSSYPHARGAADEAVVLPSDPEKPLAGAPCATPAELEQACRDLADELGIKFGQIVHPIRAVISGTTKGAGLFDLVFLVGKERCVERLRRATAATR